MSSTEDEQLDPRVQVELEKLNTATDDINKLESKLEEANYVFRTTLTESTARLKALGKKLGSCIEKARPFYEAQELARSSQLDCQRAAVQYQRANALHHAAKETIALAEERFVNCRHQHWQFDSAWQEMLNHATMKVMEAEAQKAASEREHMRRAAAFTQAEQKVQQLQRGLRSAINKSLVYFEEKGVIKAQLEGLKERVQQLQQAISASKSSYAQSLRSLELISEEIHEQRRCRLPREPGVGAELTPPEVSDTAEYSAKSFTPLEEMTAKEEKYWETLREKLEKLQIENQNKLSAEEEVLSDVESLDCRERTVTGSSYTSNHELEHSLEVERIISGESSLGSESDRAQSPAEGKEMSTDIANVPTVKSNLILTKADCEISSIHSANEISLDVQEVEMEFDQGTEMNCKKKVSGENSSEEEDTTFVNTRTTGASPLLVNKVDNEDTDVNLNRDVAGINLSNAHYENSIMRETSNVRFLGECRTFAAFEDEMTGFKDDNDDYKNNMNVDVLDLYKVKERGDGSSSPPPAMCQPSRSLSAIPESQES